MNKVIFLDIDGVLNSCFWNDTHQKEISDGTLIDVEKIRLLGELVASTGAHIILHSGWRFWFENRLEGGLDGSLIPLRKEAEKLTALLDGEGLKLSGVTPDFTTEEIRSTKKFSLVKGKEILAWLSTHPKVEKWVVLDDLELHEDTVRMHQIKTDPCVGLTLENIQQAKEILR